MYQVFVNIVYSAVSRINIKQYALCTYFSETLITRTADLLVSEGYAAAGYEYVGIDDCWLEYNRGDDGRLVPDKKRFPRGMKFIGDYVSTNYN